MKITTVGVCIICGIFPLLILPQLPGTLTLASLTVFACVLVFIPFKNCPLYRADVAVFRLGHISSKANFVGRRNLNWRDAGCNC